MVNVAINVVELAGNVFQYADLETVLTFNAKRGMFVLFMFGDSKFEISSHGIHVAAKDLIHSRRANREVFVDIGWIPYTVCTGKSCDPGMIAHSACRHSPILSLPVDYTRSIPRVAGIHLSVTEIKTSQRLDLIVGF